MSDDGLLVPHQLTKVTLRQVYDALAAAWPEGSRASLIVLTAQIGIECADGARVHNYNLGNVKRVQGRPWTMLPKVWEILRSVPPGATSATQRHDGLWRVVFDPPHPQCHFRAFSTLEEGTAEHLATLRRRFFAAWPAVESGDAAAFGRRLKALHYYTAPEADYVRALELRAGRLDAEVPPRAEDVYGE